MDELSTGATILIGVGLPTILGMALNPAVNPAKQWVFGMAALSVMAALSAVFAALVYALGALALWIV